MVPAYAPGSAILILGLLTMYFGRKAALSMKTACSIRLHSQPEVFRDTCLYSARIVRRWRGEYDDMSDINFQKRTRIGPDGLGSLGWHSLAY